MDEKTNTKSLGLVRRPDYERGKGSPSKKAALTLFLVVTALFATGCLQERMRVKPPHVAYDQLVRWEAAPKIPVGTWGYKVILNPKFIDTAWTGHEQTGKSRLYIDGVKVETESVTVTAASTATGEPSDWGMRTFTFWDKDYVGDLGDNEPFDAASIALQPFGYHKGKDWFTRKVIVRFYLYEDTFPDVKITNAAVAGTFNNWGSGDVDNKNEFRNDGVAPDEKTDDALWTVDVPIESGQHHEYKFVLNGQWIDNKWQYGDWRGDPCNFNNENEDLTGNSLITIK